MQAIYPYLLAAWVWVSAHPIETLLIVVALFNVLYAQFPRAKGGKIDKAFEVVHSLSIIFVTKAEEKGTFQFPFLLKTIFEFLSKPSAEPRTQQPTVPDAPASRKTDPPKSDSEV